MTAIMASTFLQRLVGPGANAPTFEQIAELVCRLARRFMTDRRRFMADRRLYGSDDDGMFWAALFGWCPHEMKYKIAHIDPKNNAGSFRVELDYPSSPETDGEPWLILGTGRPAFLSTLAAYHKASSAPRYRQDGGRGSGPNGRRSAEAASSLAEIATQ
jgi:hypothetical protein